MKNNKLNINQLFRVAAAVAVISLGAVFAQDYDKGFVWDAALDISAENPGPDSEGSAGVWGFGRLLETNAQYYGDSNNTVFNGNDTPSATTNYEYFGIADGKYASTDNQYQTITVGTGALSVGANVPGKPTTIVFKAPIGCKAKVTAAVSGGQNQDITIVLRNSQTNMIIDHVVDGSSTTSTYSFSSEVSFAEGDRILLIIDGGASENGDSDTDISVKFTVQIEDIMKIFWTEPAADQRVGNSMVFNAASLGGQDPFEYKLYINGTNLIYSNSIPPLDFIYDTAGLSDGTYQLTLDASENGGAGTAFSETRSIVIDRTASGDYLDDDIAAWDKTAFQPGYGSDLSVAKLKVELGAGPATVDVKIFNSWGGMVRILRSELEMSGSQIFIWDGKDDLGNDLPSGAYIAVVKALGKKKKRKIRLIR